MIEFGLGANDFLGGTKYTVPVRPYYLQGNGGEINLLIGSALKFAGPPSKRTYRSSDPLRGTHNMTAIVEL